MMARRYLLRDPGSGEQIGRAASLDGAIRRARQRSRSVSHAVPGGRSGHVPAQLGPLI
jgi:hypothetical protein